MSQQRKIPVLRTPIKPSPSAATKKAAASEQYSKPLATKLGQMFAAVDKLCSAPFMKKITGLPTKKAATLFIAENATVYNFFKGLEVSIAANNVEICNKITAFFSTTEIMTAISAFKIHVKQIEAEQKIMKKKAEEQKIIEEARARIVQEEKNRILIEYLQEQAKVAKMKGDENTAQELALQAMKLSEKQQKIDREAAAAASVTDSSDSDQDFAEDEADDGDDGDDSVSSSTSSRKNKASNRNGANASAVASPASEMEFDIDRVIQIINATNDAGLLVVKHGDKEFKITNLITDRVNEKLVLNVEPVAPIAPITSKVKVSF